MNYVLSPSAVQKIRRAITPRLGDGPRQSSSPSAISFDLYPPPFTVRWAASLASAESSEGAGDATDGEWIIYLPTSGVLMVGGSAVNLTSALTAAGSPYPAGWYKLVADYEESGTAEPIIDRDTGGTLYLVITGSTAKFDDQPGSVGGTTSVKIATATVVATTGERKVKQFVTSSIVIAASVVNKVPWTFVPGVDADPSSAFVATGEWTNATIMIGSELVEGGHSFTISGRVYTAQSPAITGNYYLVYNVASDTWSVQAVAPGGTAPFTSYADLRVVFWIGSLIVDSQNRTITQGSGIFQTPVMPLYI